MPQERKVCLGNGEDHCCHIGKTACPFLEVNTVDGRKWACGLYRELGDWEKVHKDKRYLSVVKPIWEENNVPDCGNFECENCVIKCQH